MELIHPQFSRITIDPEVCMGKPCIRGLRFPVSTLLGYLAGGTSVDQILRDFPFLENEDILEAYAFAAASMDDSYFPLVRNQGSRA